MMQAAESREGPYRASHCGTAHGPARWRVLHQPQMRPICMVIADVLAHESIQMQFVYYDHVIKQVSAAASHPTLGNAVLPRAAIRRSHGLASHVPNGRNHILAKLGVVIEQQEFGCRRIGPRFSQLLHDPESIGMARHAETQNLASVMADHEEAIQHAERDRRHGEEIHRGNGFAMIAQKRQPAFAQVGVPRRSSQPA